MPESPAPPAPDPCHRLSRDGYLSAVTAELSRMAEVVDGADYTVTVPTCPDWTLAALVKHVARANRWMATIVEERATEPLDPRTLPMPAPDDTADYPAWLTEGARVLESAFSATDPDTPVWTWASDTYARFWLRRAVHETLVHRVDAELAVGLPSHVDGPLAADNIDEFFGILQVARMNPERPNLRALDTFSDPGRVLGLAGVDAGTAAHWRIDCGPEGFTTRHADPDEPADSTLSGPVGELALVVNRRRSLDAATTNANAVTLTGDREPWDRWLDVLTF